MNTMRIGTYNMWAKNPPQNVRQDLRNLLPEVDVVGFQEFGMPTDQRILAEESGGFATVRGDDASCPIVYRKDEFKYLEHGNAWLSDDTPVGPEGAGPATLGEKFALWVLLEHIATGRKFIFVNVHLAPSLYLPIRKALHNQQTDNLLALLVEIKPKGNLIVLGDFNVDFAEKKNNEDVQLPVTKFAAINVRANWEILGLTKRGTHGRNYIDYVFMSVRPMRYTAVAQAVFGDYGSDHNPLVVVLEVTKTIKKRLADALLRRKRRRRRR